MSGSSFMKKVGCCCNWGCWNIWTWSDSLFVILWNEISLNMFGGGCSEGSCCWPSSVKLTINSCWWGSLMVMMLGTKFAPFAIWWPNWKKNNVINYTRIKNPLKINLCQRFIYHTYPIYRSSSEKNMYPTHYFNNFIFH